MIKKNSKMYSTIVDSLESIFNAKKEFGLNKRNKAKDFLNKLKYKRLLILFNFNYY